MALDDRSAASSCDQPMRGIYGAVTICARPAGHTGKHDPIWNHKDWPEASSAAEGRYGRAVGNGDGLLHIEKEPGVTFCGETFDAYVLHWDTRTVVGCGRCLIAAGVPVKAAAS